MEFVRLGGVQRVALALVVAAGGLGCSSEDRPIADDIDQLAEPLYAAGSATFCVRDPSRGFDPTAGLQDGERLILVEAWYPIDAAIVSDASAQHARFGDY